MTSNTEDQGLGTTDDAGATQPILDGDTSVGSSSATDAAQAEWEGREPPAEMQPETQGTDPLDAELGEEGQGDLAPEDL